MSRSRAGFAHLVGVYVHLLVRVCEMRAKVRVCDLGPPPLFDL